MKSATVREVQHNLAKVLNEVEAGHTVEILRRKQPVARLIPAGLANAPASANWDGHEAQMAAVWKGAVIEGVDQILDEMRGGR